MSEINNEAHQALTEARAELRLLITLLAQAKEMNFTEDDLLGLVLALQRIADRMDAALEVRELDPVGEARS